MTVQILPFVCLTRLPSSALYINKAFTTSASRNLHYNSSIPNHPPSEHLSPILFLIYTTLPEKLPTTSSRKMADYNALRENGGLQRYGESLLTEHPRRSVPIPLVNAGLELSSHGCNRCQRALQHADRVHDGAFQPVPCPRPTLYIQEGAWDASAATGHYWPLVLTVHWDCSWHQLEVHPEQCHERMVHSRAAINILPSSTVNLSSVNTTNSLPSLPDLANQHQALFLGLSIWPLTWSSASVSGWLSTHNFYSARGLLRRPRPTSFPVLPDNRHSSRLFSYLDCESLPPEAPGSALRPCLSRFPLSLRRKSLVGLRRRLASFSPRKCPPVGGSRR